MVPQWSHSAAADRLATFWGRSFTEFNVAKAMAAREVEAECRSEGSAWAGLSAMATAVGVRQQLGTVEENKVRSPESISYEAHAHCLLHGLELGSEEEARCWSELQEILQGCSRASAKSLEKDLFPQALPGDGSEPKRARARL